MQRFERVVGACLAATLALGAPASSGTSSERAGTVPEMSDVAARVERVINGLVPPLQLAGDAVTPRSLAHAMDEEGVPALALAVVDDCEVVWSRGWGTEGDAAVSGRTPFQVGSVSKLATALVAMTMVADGTLDLDRPINDLLRSWKLPENEWSKTEPVRVRHLLSHRAGLTPTGYWFDRNEQPPDIAAILRGEAENPAIEAVERPGDRAVPSNSGFLVLQALLEDLSGQSLAALADERVFGRLGMTATAFEPVDDAFLARGVTNHGRDGSAMEGKAPLIPAAPGGLWSSAEDLGRLLAALLKSWQGRSGGLLPRDLARQMTTPQLADMALGMHTRGAGESLSIQQAGGGVGSQARVIGYPDRCQGAALVVNTDRGRRAVAETLAAVGQEYGWPDLPLQVTRAEVSTARLEPLTGRYEYDAAPGSTVTFRVDEGELLAQFGERTPFAPISVSESVFVWPGSALEIRFDAPVNRVAPGVAMGTAGLYGSHLTRVDSDD